MEVSRYFLKQNPTGGKAVCYKLVENEELETIKELVYKNGDWAITDNLIHMLVSGDMDIDEISEELAMDLLKNIY
jgi:hypothetical protein